SRYSFDVPNPCINFFALSEDDGHNPDSWFDQKANLENVPPAENLVKVSQNSPALSKLGEIQCPLTTQGVTASNHEEEDGEAKDKETDVAPQNIVGDLQIWRAAAPTAPLREGRKPASKARKALQHKKPARVRAERNTDTNTGANKEDVPPLKKMRISNSREKVTEVATKTEPPENPDLSPGRERSNLSLPSRPAAPKRANTSGKLKSTEVLELEKMEQLQREVMELRKRNEESLKAALAGAGQPVKRGSHQVTKPVDFHFCTESRMKHGESQPGQEYKEVDFAAVLRKHPSSPARVPKGPTVPKPFNLSQGNKRKLEETTSEYKSLAEQVEAFQKKTPARYHLRSRKSDEGPAPTKVMKARCTNPKTPVLLTKQRLRPPACKPSAELEAEELEKIQQHKFKAQELDHKIFEARPVLPKKPPKVLTQPIGFELETEKRIQERESKKQQEEEHFEFHSRPCPTKILEDVVGVPEKKEIPITIPRSPAFILKNRNRAPARKEEK
ncbi:TPX2 protein, partial [Turnix velox]|nr:TPX2 protein [Turnix velox]